MHFELSLQHVYRSKQVNLITAIELKVCRLKHKLLIVKFGCDKCLYSILLANYKVLESRLKFCFLQILYNAIYQ